MARPSNDRPSYLLHRQSGRARVSIDGRQKLLPGKFGSPESRAAYDRLVGGWLVNGRTLPSAAPADPTGPTVATIVLAFWKHAETHYVGPDGKPTGEADNFKQALRPLRQLYGPTPAGEFGPLALRTVRRAMIDAGWCRNVVNRQTDRIRRVFRWAVAQELVPAAVAAALASVEALRRGRDGTRESARVGPVAAEHARGVLPHLSPQVAAMLELQLLSGMRPGEVVIMRGADLDTGGTVWTYTPERHKTSAHGHARTVYLGPKAQEVIRPFLRPDLSAYLFDPREADRARRAARAAARKTPLSCGNKAGSNRKSKPARTPGPRWTTRSYYTAIRNACDRAFPAPPELAAAELAAWRKAHRWHPNQLRHAAATLFRREGDFEGAKIALGHRTDSMTEHYAQRDRRKAEELVARVG